jgi:hypothetical protein
VGRLRDDDGYSYNEIHNIEKMNNYPTGVWDVIHSLGLQRETTDFYVLDKTPAFQDARSDTQLISSVPFSPYNKATTAS